MEGHPAAYRPPRPRSDSPESAVEVAGSAAAGNQMAGSAADSVAAQVVVSVGSHPAGTEAVRKPVPEPHYLPVPEPVEGAADHIPTAPAAGNRLEPVHHPEPQDCPISSPEAADCPP